MLEVPQIAKRLGLTEPQTRRLLRALSPVVGQFVSRGRENRILISTDAIGILDRAVELWTSNGMALTQLPDVLSAELGGQQSSDNAEQLSDNDSTCPTCAAYERYINRLETDLEWFKRRVEELETRALPGPRRAPLAWLGNLFRPGEQ